MKTKEDARLDENLHSESDALVCPTNSTMESLTKARAGVEEKNWQEYRDLSSVDGPCIKV